MKNEVKPEIEIEMVCLINVKTLNIDDVELNPQTMTIRKDLYEKHLKIKAGYLNDYVLAEDQEGKALKVIEGAKPIEKIIPIENNDLTPKEDPEKPLEDPLFNGSSDTFDPFLDTELKANFVPKNERPSFDKPKKEKKQRIKAN